MGNKPEFRSDPGATHFFNPIKQKGKKASSNNKIEQKFKADTAFPEPAGSLWECFCRKEAGGDTQESENTSANKMHEARYSMEKLFVKSGWTTKTCSIIATMPECRRKSPKAKAGKCIKFT